MLFVLNLAIVVVNYFTLYLGNYTFNFTKINFISHIITVITFNFAKITSK